MPRWHLNLVEWWPVLVLIRQAGYNDDAYPPQEFTAEELADLQRVDAEFTAWQHRLAQRFGALDTDVGHSLLLDADAAGEEA
jgi:hypothetical protein